MNEHHHTRRYFFLALLIGASALGLILLWPLMTVIVLSIALAVVFSPVFKWINKNIVKSKWMASLLTMFLFLLILCVPLFFIGISVIEQSKDIYVWLINEGNLSRIVGDFQSSIFGMPINESANLQARLADILSGLTNSLGSIFSSTISTLFSFLLIFLSMFYFLKDGPRWEETVLRFSPLSSESNEKIINKLKLAVGGVLKGYLLIALVQGILMGVGLWIFKVPNATLWGLFAGIASLIPTIGTALVSIPAILFLFSTGSTEMGIGLTIWSIIIVGAIDNFLNPLVVGHKIEIHPLLVLFAVLGGISVLGPVGILIGPLVISLLYALISVFQEEMGR